MSDNNSKLTITCREATFLSSLVEEKKVSLSERSRFLLHLTICGPCHNFHSQNQALTRLIKTIATELPVERLSESKKEAIKALLKK